MNNRKFFLEAEHINKSYGSLQALKDTSLCFTENKIYGLFGRNGAGKTTLLNIIANRIFADSGTVRFMGKDITKDPRTMAENCCYMPEEHYFPARLKVKKLLSMGKPAFPNYDEEYAGQLCSRFQLNGEQQYGHLSRGYQSIVRIVLGLAAKAAITIFDEPVIGLDAVARDCFYSELIKEFSNNPRLFIISTHFIEESADLFNEAIIMDKGNVILRGAVEELLAKVFYVSGKSNMVDQCIQGRKVVSALTIQGLKTIVIEGELQNEKRLPALHYSSLTIQKFFIHLTHDKSYEESRK